MVLVTDVCFCVVCVLAVFGFWYRLYVAFRFL